MRKTSQNGIDLIKKFELFVSEAYQDAVGVWTNGWGHTSGVTKDTPPVTEAEGEENLRLDLLVAESAVERFVTVPLSTNQFDALVSFTFNLGAGNLKSSTLLRLLNRGDYTDAANEFGRWVYAGGNILKGLVIRRNAEKELFLA